MLNAEKATVTTSTKKKLGTGPAAMANQPGGSVPLMSSSTRVPLNRNEHRVANLENRPHNGTNISTSTMCNLSRKATPLYEPVGHESPLISGPGGKKKR